MRPALLLTSLLLLAAARPLAALPQLAPALAGTARETAELRGILLARLQPATIAWPASRRACSVSRRSCGASPAGWRSWNIASGSSSDRRRRAPRRQ